jgi:hypothetical protein
MLVKAPGSSAPIVHCELLEPRTFMVTISASLF